MMGFDIVLCDSQPSFLHIGKAMDLRTFLRNWDHV